MTLEVDNDANAPVPFVCCGRDLRDLCRSFAKYWDIYEKEGCTWAFISLHERFILMRECMSGMHFYRYVNNFKFTPSPLGEDEKNESASCGEMRIYEKG